MNKKSLMTLIGSMTAVSILSVCVGCAARAGSSVSLTLDIAQGMASACLSHAREMKWSPLSIAIVDEGGAPIVLQRQDGAAPAMGEAALWKAGTAVRTRVATRLLAGGLADQPTRDLMIGMKLAAIPGGVPISISNERMLGAIGVSGASGEQDDECAAKALAFAQQALKQTK